MASKRQTVLEYLKNTLLPSITTGNGYNFTLATIERGIKNIRDLDDSQLPALFVTMTHEKRQTRTQAGFSADMQVILVGYVKSSKGDLNSSGTGVELDLDKLVEDVTKALEADRLQGGRVYNTTITDVATDDGDMTPNAGMVMSVVFSYFADSVAP